MSRIIFRSCVALLFVSGATLLLRHALELSPLQIFMTKVGLVVGATGILAVWSLRRLVGEETSSAFFTKLVVLGLSLITALLIGEFALRVAFRDVTSTADGTGYFSVRWAGAKVRKNSLGFREREFDVRKERGIYRIAVIGDSITFGQGIEEKDRFSHLLENQLNLRETKNIRYEVLNFGKPGAETVDHLAILKEFVVGIDPDFVLLQWFMNDFEGHDKSGRPKRAQLWPHWTHGVLERTSVVYYLLNQQWNRLRESLGVSGTYVEYMRERFGDHNGHDSREAMEALARFIQVCKERKIGMGMVLFPSIPADPGKGYPFDYLHERVLWICEDLQIKCVDLRDVFAKYGDYKALWANRLDAHPGPLANRAAAGRLMTTFGAIWDL